MHECCFADEKAPLEDWQRSHDTSPLTGQPMEDTQPAGPASDVEQYLQRLDSEHQAESVSLMKADSHTLN